MRTLLVGYDLNRPGQEYDSLIARIKQYPRWWHHLDSTWLINTDHSAVQVRDELKRFLDSGDELIVIDVSDRPAAWVGFSKRGADWLREHL